MLKNHIGIFLIVFSGIILLLGLFRKKNNYIDLRNVFLEHFKIFKHSRIQFILFYIITFIMAIGIALVCIADSNLYENIIVVMSIFVSMLMSMLSVIKSKNYSEFTEDQKTRIKLVIKETDNQVMYCTFLSIFIIMFSLIMIALSAFENCIFSLITSIIEYYLTEILLLNILLIVKRLGKLI